MNIPLPGVPIEQERDVVVSRQRARRLAELIGFDDREQTRIATAVSEIARNAYSYAGGGRIEFGVEGASRPQLFVVRVIDAGRGIRDVERVLSGEYRSSTGLGLGIVGSKRLMDALDIESSSRGTVVTMRKLLPRGVPLLTLATTKLIIDALSRDTAFDPLAPSGNRTPSCCARSTISAAGRRTSSGSMPRWRTPIAASSRSMRSSTSAQTICAVPTI